MLVLLTTAIEVLEGTNEELEAEPQLKPMLCTPIEQEPPLEEPSGCWKVTLLAPPH